MQCNIFLTLLGLPVTQMLSIKWFQKEKKKNVIHVLVGMVNKMMLPLFEYHRLTGVQSIQSIAVPGTCKDVAVFQKYLVS